VKVRFRLTSAHTCAKKRLRMTRGVRGGSFASGAVVLVPLALASNCGGRTWDPAVFEDVFPGSAAAAFCGGDDIDACCVAAGLRGKNADCVPTAMTQFEKAAAAARAAGERYDARAAAACVNAWRSAFATCPDAERLQLLPQPCSRVYVGGRTLQGSACTNPWECAPGAEGTAACLSLSATGRSGSVCGVIVQGAAGTPCNVDPTVLVECAPGLHCDPNRSICTPPLGLGDLCSNGFSDECGVGAVCDADVQRICVPPRRALGEACASGRDCDGFACFAGRCGALMLDNTRCID